MIVYDNHNILYLYDGEGTWEDRLNQKGYINRNVEIPYPHTHTYDPKYDEFEDRIMENHEWIKFPLQEGDS